MKGFMLKGIVWHFWKYAFLELDKMSDDTFYLLNKVVERK